MEFPKEINKFEQSTSHVLMIEPKAFKFNEQASNDNSFMQDSRIENKSFEEFSNLVSALRKHGIIVSVMENGRSDTPDAVFPNNWVSTHVEDNTRLMCLYPMAISNRRLERVPVLISELQKHYQKVIDFSTFEKESQFLEGTGSLVCDRVNRIAYLCESNRANIELAKKWSQTMNYSLFCYQAFAKNHQPIYHTNVILSIGKKVAIVCFECIPNQTQRENLKKSLIESNHHICEISLDQVEQFCGNVMELRRPLDGKQLLVMSSRAFQAFRSDQLKIFVDFELELVHVDFTSIETLGGGGVRCCLCELF